MCCRLFVQMHDAYGAIYCVHSKRAVFGTGLSQGNVEQPQWIPVADVVKANEWSSFPITNVVQ